ncbi:hypothetical protein B0H14DRAFT_104512 [Mycena olivaceomarginata]|nr:hypothetical protein B0H14DRAFT_104512 [Mycena olivaceomarginata]
MLQLVSNLFFQKRRPREYQKMSPFIEALYPTKHIPDVLDNHILKMSTTDWVNNISVVGTDEGRLLDLDRCIVDKVDHFRAIGNDNKDVHENAAFTFHLASHESGVAARVHQKDCRASFLHRTILTDMDAPNQQVCQHSRGDSGDSFDRKLPPNDKVRIDANYRQLRLLADQKEYILLQSFTIPPGTPFSQRLTVLDCAILASVVTHRAKDYSRLHHMCMWFAVIFFLAAHRICVQRAHLSDLKTETRDFRLAGKYGKLSLVNPRTGRLLLGGSNKLDDIKKAMRKGMIKNGVAEADVGQFLELLDRDNAAWLRDEKVTGSDPIGAIVVLFEARRKQIRERMSRDITVAWEKRTALERQVQAERERRIAAEQQVQAEREERIAAEQQVQAEREERIAAEQQVQAEREERVAAEMRAQAAEERAQAAEARARAAEEQAADRFPTL